MNKTFTCSMQKKKESFAKKSEGVEALKDKVVSDGTLKPEDLIPKFLNALKHDETAHAKFLKDNPEILEIQSWDDVDDETKSMLVDELTDALNDIAPDGYFFGASDGDGACFGFWKVDPDESKQPESKTCEATFKQGVDDFISCAPSGGWSDYWAMQQDWEMFKDGLCRDGRITQRQADSWGNPCTPETFNRWQKRNGLTRRGGWGESKKSEGVRSSALERIDAACKKRGLYTEWDNDKEIIITWGKGNFLVEERVYVTDTGDGSGAASLNLYFPSGQPGMTINAKGLSVEDVLSFIEDPRAWRNLDSSKKWVVGDGKKSVEKKSEGVGGKIKMGIDYNMFMRMCASAAYLDENEDYWDALWEYYSEMGEIEDACEFFDNLFQYTSWCDEDEVYDEYLDDSYKDGTKSKAECIEAAVDAGDLDVFKTDKGYLVIQ